MRNFEPLATIEDLKAFWRDLDASEEQRAETLLTYASAMLRMTAAQADEDIDCAIKCDGSGQYAVAVRMVICEAVRRAMNTPTDVPPVETYTQTAGPYSENYKFSNPSGDLWFKKSELKTLGIGGNQGINSIEPNTRGEIYGN